MRITFLFSASLLCTVLLHAQLEVSRALIETGPSCIVLHDGSTLEGDIRYAKAFFGGKLNKIIFTDEKGQKTKYHATELSGFTLHDQEYVSMKVEGNTCFLREVIKGEYSLYYMEFNYAQRQNLSAEVWSRHGNEGRTLRMYVSVFGKLHRIYRPSFKGQAKKLFSDKKYVVEKIDNQEYRFLDMEKIIQHCNSQLISHVR